eukprot:6396538-Alexandrium_andersonii.AAC.1
MAHLGPHPPPSPPTAGWTTVESALAGRLSAPSRRALTAIECTVTKGPHVAGRKHRRTHTM